MATRPTFELIHPLEDPTVEEKCNADALGPMAMTPGRRFCLILLKAYLVLMVVLVLIHCLQLGGCLHR